MTAVAVILGVVVIAIIFFFVNLLLSIRQIPKKGIQAQILEPQESGALRISLTRSGLKRKVILDSIIIDRNLAEAMQATPPAGFREDGIQFPKEEDFEGDLTILTDEKKIDEITLKEIQEEIKKQFEEENQITRDLNERAIVWRGSLLMPPGEDIIVCIPRISKCKAAGKIIFSYQYTGGLWSAISDSCSVNCTV